MYLGVLAAAEWLFPAVFAAHAAGWLEATLILSVSFLVFSILDFNSESYIARVCYIIAGTQLACAGYFMLASIASVLVYFLLPWFRAFAPELFFSLAVIITIYGIINARILRTVNLNVALPNLPPVWRNRTAIMVSDLHLGHVLRDGFIQKVVRRINQLKPDIVFVPGDFFDGVKTTFDELAAQFKNVHAPLGIYFVSGNHEEIAGMQDCEQAIGQAGIVILEDAKTEVDGLQILGAAYHHETDDSVRQLFASFQIDRTRPSIFLKHVPNRIPLAAEAGVSLQLSGHSHQGQIWPGNLITKSLWKGFDYGLRRLGNFQIYTSSGAGTWGPPLRVFTKSEIVRITFHS